MNTPKTDALLHKYGLGAAPDLQTRYTDMCQHARQLETQVQELRETLAYVEELLCDGEWSNTKADIRAILEKTS